MRAEWVSDEVWDWAEVRVGVAVPGVLAVGGYIGIGGLDGT